MKYHSTKDKCDICGLWIHTYECFYDKKGEAKCVCDKCCENIENNSKGSINTNKLLVQTKLL